MSSLSPAESNGQSSGPVASILAALRSIVRPKQMASAAPGSVTNVDFHMVNDHHECVDLLLPDHTTNKLAITTTEDEMPQQVMSTSSTLNFVYIFLN